MIFGRSKSREACASCSRPISRGQKVCVCGTATQHMDFAERTAYEVEQWRSHRRQQRAS